MSFFSEERVSELKDLFFESAQELLQTLNEGGLELEKHPGDAEIFRSIRRCVHTLKGDAAACGYTELSDLAHELEDVLTPELAARADASTAQVVLSAADCFDAMLAAYRSNMQPPAGNSLRDVIQSLLHKPGAQQDRAFAPSFLWTEYERLVIERSLQEGQVFNVAVEIDPQCVMRSAALEIIRKALQESGTVLVVHPEEGSTAHADVVEAAIASEHDPEWISRKCRIPSIVSNLVIQSAKTIDLEAPAEDVVAVADEQDILGLNLPASMQLERQQTATNPSASAVENILRVDAERIDNVLDLVGELIIGKSMLHQAISDFGKRYPKDPLRQKFADLMAFQSQSLHALQRSVMKVRMVPVEQLFRRFPRVVRDIGKMRDKEVTLEMSGQETDLDKSILDALADPLTHMIRNAVDHGIESPQERIAVAKPARGIVRLSAYHQGNHVVIEIQDDGRGIDPQKILTKAIDNGVLTPESASKLTDAEILELIFEPGFSTADEVTAISGRGVGLDVVKTAIERLKGTVSIKTELGQGTKFLLKLPLTLAIIRALLFNVSDRMFAVPLSSVLEIARATEADIHRVDNHEVLQLREELLTLVRLSRLTPKSQQSKTTRVFIVVVSMFDRKFGLIVDRLLGEEELVIKALDDHLVSTDLVSGASILGDGIVVLILNIPAVVERLGKTKSCAFQEQTSAGTFNPGKG